MIKSEYYWFLANICIIMSFVSSDFSSKICLIFLGVFNIILYSLMAFSEIKLLQREFLIKEKLLKSLRKRK